MLNIYFVLTYYNYNFFSFIPFQNVNWCIWILYSFISNKIRVIFPMNSSIATTNMLCYKYTLLEFEEIKKNLASRGLPFRGHNEIMGFVKNSNFLMIFESLSEFDPFLSQYITRFQNSGSKTTLSSTI